MIPQPNQPITIYFRQGFKVEGTVISWSHSKSVIQKKGSSAKIVIQKTQEDILFYEVSDVKNEYQTVKDKPIKTHDDIRTLASLKKEMNVIEREEIQAKLNTHVASGNVGTENYGLPVSIAKVESTIKHPRKEAPREDNSIGAGLQGLFKASNKDH